MATASQPTLASMWGQPAGSLQAAATNLQGGRRVQLPLAAPQPHPTNRNNKGYLQQGLGPRAQQVSTAAVSGRPQPTSGAFIDAPRDMIGHEAGVWVNRPPEDMSNPPPFQMLQGPVTRVHHTDTGPQGAPTKPYGALPPPELLRHQTALNPGRCQGSAAGTGSGSAPVVQQPAPVPSWWADIRGSSPTLPREVRNHVIILEYSA